MPAAASDPAWGDLRVDLHAHSMRSDGTEAPAELVDAARTAGLDVVALTDHDTFAGWAEAEAQARRDGIGVVPGLEFSTRLGRRSFHLLGYLMDPDDPELLAEMARIRGSRLTRAQHIVERLAPATGLTWGEVLAQVHGDAPVGRPHIADALVARGAAPNRSAAFAGILRPPAGGLPVFYAPTPERAIELVRHAGGVPVLAHPGASARGGLPPRSDLESMVAAGLGGVEVDHRENPDAVRASLRTFARDHDLIMTGSSDYHGAGKPNRLGENLTAASQLRRILAEGRGIEPVLPERLQELLER
jgi:predicted metal-dependent phosphoesterase TrpH